MGRAFSHMTVVTLSLVFFVHRGITDRWVDAAPALRSAQPRRRAPHHFRFRVPSQRSRQRGDARRGGGPSHLPLLISPVFPCPLLFPGFDAPRRRDPQNATRRARDHCGSPVARSPIREPIQLRCLNVLARQTGYNDQTRIHQVSDLCAIQGRGWI